MLATAKVLLIKGPNSACYTFKRVNDFYLLYKFEQNIRRNIFVQLWLLILDLNNHEGSQHILDYICSFPGGGSA